MSRESQWQKNCIIKKRLANLGIRFTVTSYLMANVKHFSSDFMNHCIGYTNKCVQCNKARKVSERC